MFIPGPKIMSILLYTSSSPRKEYSFFTSSGLNVHACKVPFGRLNACAPESSLKPLGPSVQQPHGIPLSVSDFEIPPKAAAVPGVTLGLPIPSPRTIHDKSSSESVFKIFTVS